MFGQLIRDIKAYFRGERRVGPRGARGRVYQSRVQPEVAPSGSTQVSARASGTLTMVITRADGSTETVVVPATAEKLKT
jgi:hypothetical protein